MDVSMHELMHPWMHGWMDGYREEGQMHGWIDGWMHAWMHWKNSASRVMLIGLAKEFLSCFSFHFNLIMHRRYSVGNQLLVNEQLKIPKGTKK